MQELSETETESKKQKVRSFLFAIVVIIFIITTFTIPFLQVFFPVKSISVINATNAYNKIDNAKLIAEKQLRSIIYDYHKKVINDQEFNTEISIYVPLIQKLEKESEALSINLQNIKKQDKVFGFRTLKVFFANLGMPVVAVFLGFFLLFLFNKEQDLFFRKVILAFGFVGTITGLFYVVWVFYPKGDLPETTYIVMQLSFAISGALVAFIVGKYFFALSQLNLKIKIQDLLSFITSDVKRKYISKHDRREFISDYLGEIEKLSKK